MNPTVPELGLCRCCQSTLFSVPFH